VAALLCLFHLTGSNNLMADQHYLKLLTTAFENEYNDVFLYLREADTFGKRILGTEKLHELFNAFSQMELRHADRIAMRIIELGGTPQWVFKPIEQATSLRTALKKHAELELSMYRFYTELVKQEEDNDFKIILKGIRENEREHLEKTTELLKKVGEADA